MSLNPFAVSANEALSAANPAVLELLSEMGKRLYYPAQGIPAQGGQAKAKAKLCNATVGLAAAACDASSDLMKRYVELLTLIQSRLFDIGADLATPSDSKHADKVARFDAAHVTVM